MEKEVNIYRLRPRSYDELLEMFSSSYPSSIWNNDPCLEIRVWTNWTSVYCLCVYLSQALYIGYVWLAPLAPVQHVNISSCATNTLMIIGLFSHQVPLGRKEVEGRKTEPGVDWAAKKWDFCLWIASREGGGRRLRRKKSVHFVLLRISAEGVVRSRSERDHGGRL